MYGVRQLLVPRTRLFYPSSRKPRAAVIVFAANRGGKPRVPAADQHGLEGGAGFGRKGRRHHRTRRAEVSSGLTGPGKIGGRRQVSVRSDSRRTSVEVAVVVSGVSFFCGCGDRGGKNIMQNNFVVVGIGIATGPLHLSSHQRHTPFFICKYFGADGVGII